MEIKSARILFVEDDEDDYILTVDQLEKLDDYCFEIDWVSTRDEALSRLQCNEHDICLLDNQLGAYTGLDVLNQANALGSTVPIIMLTGQSDEELDKMALDAGAADFLTKGDITNARFARAIRYAISRVEVQKARQQSIDAITESKAKDRFIAHLSHELRTPLTSILGYAELLINSDKAEDAHKELSAILNNGKHLLSLLNDILDLSKIAAGKLQLKSEKLQLNSFIADIFTLMQVPATAKGLILKCECITDIPETINTDPTRLRQVIINLIFNAIKFTHEGQVTMSVSYSQQSTPGLLQFVISDTGIGISKQDLESIFIPFQQLEEVTLKNGPGAGLGLAISNELIRRMNGKITVESEIDKGSEFTLSLPINVTEQVNLIPLNIGISEVQPKGQFEPLQGMVLVVDDLEDIRQLVGNICQSFGLNTIYAKNGQHALEIIASRQHAFDLVIMDIHMPVMDGREAIVNIRKLGFSNPIFALTAANMKGVDTELRELGFTNVITKPVQQIELYAVLNTALSNQTEPLVSQCDKPLHEDSQHVLVVEDDEDAAELIVMLLETIGVNAEAVHSYQSCLEKLTKAQLYTHVFLDKNLPDGNGLDLAQHINTQKSSDLQVILISGEEVEPDKADDCGISHSLLKPIKLSQLRAIFQQP